MPACMSLDDRVMHIEGEGEAARAYCGAYLIRPIITGTVPDIASRADTVCLDCFYADSHA